MDTRKIGPYEVGDLIGKGGMGEVYRARDTRLSRDVALKVLPAAFAADADRLARFDREAKVLASLQHQNIAQIFGLEASGEQPVLVLELAEGEDLNRRIAAGPLPVDEARKIARQLALGLEYAHERGVVHRDLKPANVKIGPGGQVKILDFGLARAFGGESGDSSSSAFEPTLTQALTQAGAVLGTAAYMSPEQARGYDVDRRSDIWAFGVILFEMLTGRRLFQGETATDTLAAVMRKEPEWTDLPADAPLLAQLCRRCLERDPQQRLRDIGEARIALEGDDSSVLGLSTTGLLPPAPAPAGRGGGPVPWIVAAVLAVALAGVAFLGFTGGIGPRPEPAPVVLSAIQLDEGMRVDLNPASPGPVQVAPDGSSLAFAVIDSAGQVSLCVRDLDSPAIRALPGTQGASYAFWSHDSGSLAFFTDDGLLRRLDISGGPVLTVCSAENGKGGDWNQFDEIIYAPSHVASIHLVSANGGEPRPVSSLSSDRNARSHRFPSWLPDGEHFLYLAVQRGSGNNNGTDSILHIAHKDGSLDRELLPVQASAYYSRGHILFVHDQALMARPFDPQALEFTGPAFPICQDVMAIRAAHCATFSAVDSDVMAYSTGQGGQMGVSVLEVIDNQGRSKGQLGESLMARGLAYSPDGRYVAVSEPDVQIGTFDLWLHEVERNLSTRLTFDSESEQAPVWSPDGQWVYFFSDQDGAPRVYRQRASGTGRSELLFERDECIPTSVSPDGSLLCYTFGDSTGDYGIGMFDLVGDSGEQVWRDTGMIELQGAFSRDGEWLAYVSFETSTMEVFVESLQEGGGRYRVSTQGGVLPRWSPGGDRLYYLTQNGEIMAVDIESSEGALRFGRTRRIADGVEFNTAKTFDVQPVTGDLLVQRPSQDRQYNTLVLVTGWSGLLGRGKE